MNLQNNSLKFLVAILLGTLLLGSCTKKLDDPRSTNSIETSRITVNEIPALTRGIYAQYIGNYLKTTYVLSDVYSDNFQPSTFGYIDMAYEDCNVAASDLPFSLLNSLMSQCYRAIANANLVINAVNDNNWTSANSYKGQALLMRAYTYLQLVNHFGGVVITTGKELNSIRAKNTATEVYDFIIRDLKEIIDNNLLPGFSKASEGNMQAAKALLARVYLQLGKNAEAKTLALDVIQNSGGVRLNSASTFASNFTSAGSDAAKETLLKVQEGPVKDTLNYGPYSSLQYYADAYPTTFVLNSLFETGDIRGGFGQHFYFPFKVYTKFRGDLNPVYPLIRLSEMYLTTAEADARLGNIDVTNYNQVRRNRGVTEKTNADFATTDAFLTAIALERQREFLGEGLRWEDMKRFGLAIPFLQSKGRDATRLLFPIPQTQLNINTELKQNPGY